MSVDHWPLWIKFVRAELACGGPDSQFELLRAAYDQMEHPEVREKRVLKMWLIGIYASHHNAPSTLAIYQRFPDPKRVLKDPKALKAFLKEHWKYLPVRPECRSHRMLAKRHQCLMDFARYAVEETWRIGTYDDLWADAQRKVKFYGRYMSIKVLELVRRFGVRTDMVMPDVRARHAWSPRTALGLLNPGIVKKYPMLIDRADNSEAACVLAEGIAIRTRRRMIREFDTRVSFFQLQGLLCNYRSVLTGTFYPGAGHDEELEYIRLNGKRFPSVADLMYETRKGIFHSKYLGEVGGWDGPRDDQYAKWKARGAKLGHGITR